MRHDALVLLVPDHPREREEDIRGVFAFQYRPQQVVVVVRLHIVQLYIRVKLVEAVELRLQCLEVGIASDHRDLAFGVGVQPRLEGAGGVRLRPVQACRHGQCEQDRQGGA